MTQAIEIGRDDTQRYVLTPKQRRTHLHIIGPSEGGKSRLMEHMIRQDIQAGHGLCLLDPTGNLYERLALWCAARGMHRRRKIHFVDPNSDDFVVGYNPLARRPGEDVSKQVDAMILASARAWGEDPNSTPLLKRCLRAVFTVLIEHDLTLAESLELILPPVTDEQRAIRSFLTRSKNKYVARAWQQWAKTDPKRMEEVFGSTNNRLAEFLISERMERIFGYGEGSLDLKRVMDEGHVLLVNVQPGQLSLDNSRLLGTLITNELLQLARGRDNALGARMPFYVYIDEAYKYLTDDIEQAIDETRQKGLHYILAHQRLTQLRDAGPQIEGGVMSIRNKVVFGNLEEKDTQTLARDLFQKQYDENATVEALDKPVTVAYELRRNQQWRAGTSEGLGTVQGETRARSLNEADNAVISLPFDNIGMLSGDLNQGGGRASARGQSKAKQFAETANQSKTEMAGWAESLAPVLKMLPSAVRSYEEQMNMFARALKALPRQTIYLKLNQTEAIWVPVPYVGDPITHQRRLANFYAEAAEASDFTVPMAAAKARMDRRYAELLALAFEDEEEVISTKDAYGG